MSRITSRKTGQDYDAKEWELRVDLAAAFRLAVHYNWHESVGNHFSAAVSSDGKKFLLNPKWQHFSTVCASDLLLLDADDPDVMNGPDAPDATAWCIHGAVHAALPNARVLLHCHPDYVTALATLKDPSMKPIDQNTARFFNRIAIDLGFGGLAEDAEEGQRIARAFGNKSVMMMGNHGVTVAADTVAEAFEHHLTTGVDARRGSPPSRRPCAGEPRSRRYTSRARAAQMSPCRPHRPGGESRPDPPRPRS